MCIRSHLLSLLHLLLWGTVYYTPWLGHSSKGAFGNLSDFHLFCFLSFSLPHSFLSVQHLEIVPALDEFFLASSMKVKVFLSP